MVLRLGLFGVLVSVAVIEAQAAEISEEAKQAEEESNEGQRLQQLRAALQKLFEPYGNRVSFSLRSLWNEGEKIGYHSNRLFPPASVTKVVSSACAMESLGPNYQFSTQFLKKGELKDGVLKGDLVVKGGGDPSFVIENLQRIVEQLYELRGIQKIEGELVFDTSLLKEPKIVPYQGFENSQGRAFNAPLTAAPINHNAFSIWVIPAEKPDIRVLPKGAIDLNITNRLKSVSAVLRGSRTNLDYRLENSRLIMSGQVGKQDELRAYYRALNDPYESFARLFDRHFEKVGGEWDRKWSASAEVETNGVLWEHSSRALSRLLVDVNKLSTNFAAEMGMLVAANERLQRSVNVKDSASTLKHCLEGWGFSDDTMQLKNASGLSRSSLMKSKAMSKFLRQMSRKTYWPELLSSLSTLGVDGTLENRLKPYASRARLKTGTLQGVRSLSGYVFAEEGKIWTMALFLNCPGCDMRQWEAVEDRVITRLIEFDSQVANAEE